MLALTDHAGVLKVWVETNASVSCDIQAKKQHTRLKRAKMFICDFIL